MPKIESPIGSRSFSASSSGQRTFEVPDESDSFHEESDFSDSSTSVREIEERVRQARVEKITGISKISPAAKKRVEILANIGRISKEVEFEGTKFTLRTLKQKELRDSIMATANAQHLDHVFEGRKQQLARSLIKVDAHTLEAILGTDEMQAKVDFFDELDEGLVNFLYRAYVKLTEESNKKFGLETESDVKEVTEDLKKS